MAPRLRVLAGTSPGTMVPITSVVNTTQTHKLSSRLFEGELVVNIKGFVDPDSSQVRDSEYFERADRQGITWSIQVRGRFLTLHSADDILFGNTFDRPLGLPWGSSAALKFMHYIDLTLEHDLTSSTKPWALSPLISTMPHFTHTRIPGTPTSDSSEFLAPPSTYPATRKTAPQIGALPPFPPLVSIADDTTQLHLTLVNSNSPSGSTSGSASSSTSSISSISSSGSKPKNGIERIKRASKVLKHKRTKSISPSLGLNLENASQRRSYFSTSPHRQAVQFGPKDVITTDFCYGFLEFQPSLSLRIPGGLSFDLMRYWDGQPVRFVCCERKYASEEHGDPWGTIFWCVSIEMGDDADE